MELFKNSKAPWLDDEEYLEIIKDIKDHKQVLKLDTITHHFITTRLQHSYRVSYKSYLIAKKHGLDYKACARAGLLHDLFFFLPKKVNINAKFMHPRFALKNAQKITDLSYIEKDIIVHHMFLTGASTLFDFPRTSEGMVVTYVDKIVAKYEASEMIKHKWNSRKYYQKLPNFTEHAL